MLKAWINGSRMLPPWLALAILLGLQAASLPFLLNIHFNNAGDIYSPADAPIIQLRESLFREFPSDEALIALFEGEKLFSPAFLGALDRVAKKWNRILRWTACSRSPRSSISTQPTTVSKLRCWWTPMT